MRCAILEDDKSCQEQIVSYIEKYGRLKLEGVYSNIPDAMNYFKGDDVVDLLFLDVELGAGNNGLSFYVDLKTKPYVIVMTAHPKYALDSHKMHAHGFLHKPFDYDIFKESVDYAINEISKQKKLEILHQIEYNAGNYIPILDDKKEIALLYSEIAYFEAKGNNVIVYTIYDIEYNLGRRSISQLEKELPYQLFQRINKKQIINKSNVQKIFGDVVRINNKMLKISTRCLAEINKSADSI